MNITTHCLKTNNVHTFDLYSLYPCFTNSFFQILIWGFRHIKMTSKARGRLAHEVSVTSETCIQNLGSLSFSLFYLSKSTYTCVCVHVCVSCIFEFIQSHSMSYTRETPHIWNELIATKSRSIKIIRTVKKVINHCGQLCFGQDN